MKGLTSFPNPELAPFMPSDVSRGNLPYRFMRAVLQVTLAPLCRTRVFGREYEPTRGGAVYICNHQSFLDPMLMSYSLRRPMSYMARESLFRFGPFGKLITAFNAFPVRRGTADMGAMKEAIRRLKSGEQLVIFAEGTRTLDGRIGPFLPGVAMLAQKVAEWTVPCVIDGAFESWPRSQKLPSPGSIVVQYAPAIAREEIRKMDPQEFLNHVRDIMIDMQAHMRRRAGREPLVYS